MRHYCGDCKYHHNAHHPKTSKLARNYNDWCCKGYGKTARKAIGECKIKGWKETK